MAPRLDPAVVVSTALGIALCALGAASLGASLIAWPHGVTLEAARRQETVDPAAAASAVRASLRAARWANGCQHLTNAALVAPYVQGPAVDAGDLAAAALERCPTSPHNWMRLALSRQASGDGDGARIAWRLSVLTGGYVPRLQAQRLELGLRLLSGSDREFLDLLGNQIRLVVETDVAALASAAKRTRTLPIVRLMLRGKPAGLAAFETEVSA